MLLIGGFSIDTVVRHTVQMHFTCAVSSLTTESMLKMSHSVVNSLTATNFNIRREQEETSQQHNVCVWMLSTQLL